LALWGIGAARLVDTSVASVSVSKEFLDIGGLDTSWSIRTT